MEGDLGLGLVLLAVLLFGWGGLFTWRRFRRGEGAVDPKGAYPGDPKARVMGRVLDAVARSITSDLERTEMSYHPGDPREVLTLIVDIEQFRHLRKHRGMMQYEGIFVERDIERRWARRPPRVREWEGIEIVAPIAIKAAFDADVWINTVRFWVGDIENYALTICRVSVEAKRLQSPTAYDWRFDKRAKGYLAPVTPHGNRSPSLTAVALAEDPYDFEQQVAQMLRDRRLTVEVTGGTGDEGVDIIAYDNTPVTGGTFLVQCKRYSLDKKVGVAEVRELYGTMQEKQSAKGVLVTSSTFTAGALKFAEGKSIELIDGARLSEMVVGTVAHTGVAIEDTTRPSSVAPLPDVYLKADLDFSVHDDDEGTTNRLASNEDAQQRLVTAINLLDPEAVAEAIAMGADVDSTGPYGALPLHSAIFMASLESDVEQVDKHVALINALLSNGADPNLRTEHGRHPLHGALDDYCHPRIVAALIRHGADVNALEDLLGDLNSLTARTPLGQLVYQAHYHPEEFKPEHLEVIAMLVDAGAETDWPYAMAAHYGLSEDILGLLQPPSPRR